ncbi:LPXTG cell wall anchor domain-containing protein, partial [Lactobacillus sp.]
EKPSIPTDPGKPSIPDNPTTAKTVYDKRYNKKPRHDTGQKLPKTNYQNTLWLTILGLVILMLVAVIIYRNKKADQAE